MQVQKGNYQTVSAYCRYLIEQGDLASKLAPPKKADGSPLEMDQPPSMLISAPQRAANLQMSGNAPKLPKMNQLHQAHARAKCLHRFAHHELQAVELFAWAILRWPQMPTAMKKGFLNTIAEEQKHLKLYIGRLKAHDVAFGDLPLSDYFWRHVPTLDQSPEGPKAFLSAMGLTLEQANLDFTLMFQKAFAEAGDHKTAQVLQIVHDEEIGHVRLAKTWLNKLEKSSDDLANYKKNVPFPFGPTRAKGRQFFTKPRQAALLSDDFIAHVKDAQKEWVAKPLSLFPNFGAEEAHKEKNKELFFAIKILFEAFWQQLPQTTTCHPALRQSNDLLPAHSAQCLFPWLATEEAERKAAQQGRTLWGPQPKQVAKWHTKHQAHLWAVENNFVPSELTGSVTFFPPEFFADENAEAHLKQSLLALTQQNTKITLKPNWGFSGRGRTGSESMTHFNKILGAAKRMCHHKKGAVLEPWLERVADYSILLWLREDTNYEMKILTLHNTASGMYCGHSEDVPHKIHEQLETIGHQLAQDLQAEEYVGPVGIDAFSFIHDGKEALRGVVEINARMTMGHLAWWLLSFFDTANTKCFAFHPKFYASTPRWANHTHVLFDDGPVVFTD